MLKCCAIRKKSGRFYLVGRNLCGAETLVNAGYFEWKSVENDTFLRIGGMISPSARAALHLAAQGP